MLKHDLLNVFCRRTNMQSSHLSLRRLLNRTLGRLPRTARGERIYAIGDVHGRLDLLLALLRAIGEDDVRRERARARIILLGDVIDRGLHSRDVIALLMLGALQGKPIRVLRGNHEAALLACLDGDPAAQELWLSHGGRSTLEDYEVALPAADEDASRFVARLEAALGDETIAWLRSLPVSERSGDYFFCHAGVRPGVPLALQDPSDLLWIRSQFLDSQRDHGAIIVHGHTPCGRTPDVRPNRINLDTGAHETGILSAIGLEGEQRWVLSASLQVTRYTVD